MNTADNPVSPSRGLWFHGTPIGTLRHFKSSREIQGGIHSNSAVYFARTPVVCCPYAWRKGGPQGDGGWVHAVKLNVESPFHLRGIFRNCHFSQAEIEDLSRQGHDCALIHDLWDELALFSPIHEGLVEIVATISGAEMREAFRLARQPGQDAAIERAWRGRIAPAYHYDRRGIWRLASGGRFRLGGHPPAQPAT